MIAAVAVTLSKLSKWGLFIDAHTALVCYGCTRAVCNANDTGVLASNMQPLPSLIATHDCLLPHDALRWAHITLEPQRRSMRSLPRSPHGRPSYLQPWYTSESLSREPQRNPRTRAYTISNGRLADMRANSVRYLPSLAWCFHLRITAKVWAWYKYCAVAPGACMTWEAHWTMCWECGGRNSHRYRTTSTWPCCAAH